MASAKQLSLKLLVDKEKNRVVFAEADEDFADILFSFLALPMGTIVRLLNKRSAAGCMDNLYESVENFDLRYLQTKACKTMLLRPRSASEKKSEGLKLNVDDTTPRQIYKCPTWDCSTKTFKIYCPARDAKCRCGLTMDKVFVWVKENANIVGEGDGVFVKGGAKFTVTDDLHVSPASTYQTLSLLDRFGINKDGTILEECTVNFAREEILNLLKRSLVSKMPLTDVFLRKLDTNSEAEDRDQKRDHKIQPNHVECNPATEFKKINLKLLLSKAKNVVVYAEADEAFVDLLFSFLTFPLGSVIKLLDKHSSINCLDNLYKSVEDLITYDTSIMKSEQCNSMLLSPKLAPGFGCTNQILRVDEMASSNCSMFGCQNCFNSGVTTGESTKCCHGIEHVSLSAINPKLADSGTESGGGFAKGPGMTFMVTDELEVRPLSPITTFQIVDRVKVPVSDLEVKDVSMGESEALKMLKESLISKRVLSNVFCCKKRRTSLA